MGRKKILEKRMARLTAKRDGLKAKALASQSVEEVRSLNEQIEEVNADIEDVQEELNEIAADEARAAANVPPANAVLVNGSVVGSAQMGQTTARENEDVFATMEYRQAFKAYVQRGVTIPSELTARAGETANTNTLGATIPTTVLNEFINEIRKRYGNLYMKVRKLNIPGAVKVPIAKLQATAKWISESTVSPRQDGGEIKDYVEFSYNTLELRVAQTLLSSIVTIDLFEREIVRVMMVAYMEAMDTAIVNGSGNGQPLGILNAGCLATVDAESGQAADTVVAENIIKMRARLFPQSRANSVWLINQNVEPQLHAMSLAVGVGGVPVYMPAGGLSGSPYDTLYGRPVIPIEQCPSLGDLGDIILADLNGYILAQKGGIESAMSIHVKFDYDESVFRFVMRVDGQPIRASALTPYKGTDTLSHFVVLAAR